MNFVYHKLFCMDEIEETCIPGLKNISYTQCFANNIKVLVFMVFNQVIVNDIWYVWVGEGRGGDFKHNWYYHHILMREKQFPKFAMV